MQVDGREAYFFLINTGSDLIVRQHDGETRIAPGDVALISYSETGSFRGGSENSWISMTISQKALRELVSNDVGKSLLELMASRWARSGRGGDRGMRSLRAARTRKL
jgi:hypothetical protein